MHFLSKRSFILCNEVSDVHDNLLLKEKLDISEVSDVFRLSNINSPSVLKKKWLSHRIFHYQDTFLRTNKQAALRHKGED
jgi:hypothetical protein